MPYASCCPRVPPALAFASNIQSILYYSLSFRRMRGCDPSKQHSWTSLQSVRNLHIIPTSGAVNDARPTLHRTTKNACVDVQNRSQTECDVNAIPRQRVLRGTFEL